MGKKILLVEDDEDIRELVEYLLSDCGFKVKSMAVAADFKNNLNNGSPDLILLDIQLPDGDGRELCKLVKLNKATKRIPVILMSAHVDYKELGQNLGADAFVAKPFDIDFLVNEVKKLLPVS